PGEVLELRQQDCGSVEHHDADRADEDHGVRDRHPDRDQRHQGDEADHSDGQGMVHCELRPAQPRRAPATASRIETSDASASSARETSAGTKTIQMGTLRIVVTSSYSRQSARPSFMRQSCSSANAKAMTPDNTLRIAIVRGPAPAVKMSAETLALTS